MPRPRTNLQSAHAGRLAQRMLALLAVLLLVFIACAPLVAADPDKPADPIVGSWQGTLDVGAIKLRLVINVSRSDDGSLTSTLDSPDQGATGLTVDETTLEDRTLKLTMKKLQASFEGALDEAGTKIGGKFRQAGIEFPLELKRLEAAPDYSRPQDPQEPYPYEQRDVTYENPAAGNTLAGTLTFPKGEGPFPVVLLINGSGQQDRNCALMGHRPFLVLADHLTRKGIAVLRVDDRGIGGSTGEVAKATSVDFASDARASVEFLKRQPQVDRRHIGLLGHSEGGLIAPIVAAENDDINFVVLLAAPGVPGKELITLQGELILKAQGGSAEMAEFNKKLMARFIEELKRHPDQKEAEEALKAAVDEEVSKLDDGLKKAFADMKDRMDVQATMVTSPWFRYFLEYDPRPALAKIRCPILALNGEKDLQVDAAQNLTEIEKIIAAGGNAHSRAERLAELNHLLQTCKTGSPSEYGRIDETMSPAVLDLISAWVLEQAARNE